MKHGLVFGEPYMLEDRRYIAGLVGAPGREPDHIVLLDVCVEDDPDSAFCLSWYIDDAGSIYALYGGRGPGIWGDMGLDPVATPYTVADLVCLGIDMEVWGELFDVLQD